MRKLIKITVSLLLTAGLFACQSTPDNNGEKTEEASSHTSNLTVNQADTTTFVSYSSDAVMGEALYVPVYSHIYQRDQKRTFNLTTTLSFRNTDLKRPVTLKKVYYYDSKGNLVEKYLDGQRTVQPLASVSYVIEESDLRGGVGANFLVLWESSQQVSDPVVETVMISTSGQQGISFLSEGRVIHSLRKSGQ